MLSQNELGFPIDFSARVYFVLLMKNVWLDFDGTGGPHVPATSVKSEKQRSTLRQSGSASPLAIDLAVRARTTELQRVYFFSSYVQSMASARGTLITASGKRLFDLLKLDAIC